MKLKVFSFFSGVGGLDMPFHTEDFEVVGFSELDKNASGVLNYHWPEIKNFGDITKIAASDLPDFDIMVGGFPCTDISFQGKMAGFSGAKSSLFKCLVPVLKEKKPKYILLENVEALLSKKFGWEFTFILGALDEEGYNVMWETIDSSDHGTPQQRRRVFVFGVRKDVYFLGCNSIYEFKKNIQAKNSKGVSEFKEINSFAGYQVNKSGTILGRLGNILAYQNCNGYASVHLGVNKKSHRKLVHLIVYETFVGAIPKGFEINHKDHIKLNNKLSNLELVASKENKRLLHLYRNLKRGVSFIKGKFRARLEGKDLGFFEKKEESYESYQEENLKKYRTSPWVDIKAIAWSKSTRSGHIDYRIREDGLLNTLTTGKGCNGFSTGNTILFERNLRYLLPEECERLMTWKSGHTKYRRVGEKVIENSSGSRYKMIGNGVVSKCVEPIRDLILEIEETRNSYEMV